jgi:hypothetical protein
LARVSASVARLIWSSVMAAVADGQPVDLDCGRGCIMGPVERPLFDVLGFLNEPTHVASVATVTSRGRPALAMMWFLLEDGRLWFNSPEAQQDQPAPFLRAAGEAHDVAVMVATFDPPDDVRQFRAVGPARLEKRDVSRVRRIYERYVPEWSPSWSSHAESAKFRLWSMVPERGMAVTFPGLDDSPTCRWATEADLLARR